MRFRISLIIYAGLLLSVAFIISDKYQFGSEWTMRCKFSWYKNDEQRRLTKWETELLRAERELKRRYPEFTESVVRQRVSRDLPIIYVVTPTYARSVQKAELTRLAQTLLHVPALHWIVVEDAKLRSRLVAKLLQKSGIVHTHLSVPTPEKMRHTTKDSWWKKPRGVQQRNAGLQWIRNHLRGFNQSQSNTPHGVVYFADDDNVYDLTIFDEMRYTKTVSVWPVGLACNQRYESPLINGKTGSVVGWVTCKKRFYATDMAGFSVSTMQILNKPGAKFNLFLKPGQQETNFLRQLISGLSSLEPKAKNCTEVLVWHTKTVKPLLKNEKKLNRTGLTIIEDV